MRIDEEIHSHFRLTKIQQTALTRLGLKTIRDLLFHFPARYENIASIKSIEDLQTAETSVIYGTISGLKLGRTFRTRKPMAEGILTDDTGKIRIRWFNQPYMVKLLFDGALVKVSGKVTGTTSKYIANPEVERVEGIPSTVDKSLFEHASGTSSYFPIYPESKGITSRWFYHSLQRVFRNSVLDDIEDALPEILTQKYNLPTLKSALVWIHTPKSEKDLVSARKRFAFEEVFFIQLAKQRDRKKYESSGSFGVHALKSDTADFIKRFPFSPTNAQKSAIDTVLKDFAGKKPMSRLLEGDVGSGKTAVAAASANAIVKAQPEGQDYGNLQVAYMAPTEILAKQHFDSFVQYFSHLPVQIGLITSGGCRKFPSKVDSASHTSISRAQLLKWVANGEIPILIGTHSLIQKSVKFKNLAYVIIDEQHRFGTFQRQKLVRKDNIAPHLLSMTATPIPRTLALTIYGDLDLTLLDEMPKGRKQIITEIATAGKRQSVYESVRSELEKGRQVYVICPRIEEPDPSKLLALNVKSVEEESRRLKSEVFPEYEIDILHSKLTTNQKDEVMENFLSKKTHILVATSVVEVGVNVINATTIIIEGAERFGLAQLHQLRGRVLRSNHQAYCYLFADTKSKKSLERLRAIVNAKNGFELAESDLRLRGSGELYGRRQWGLSDMAMEAMKNVRLVEAARNEAKSLVENDPELEKFPILKDMLREVPHDLHFE